MSASNMSETDSTSNEANDKKWSCKRCTYNNYPRAKKCTMCQYVRPSHQMIIELKDQHNRNIYELTPLIVDKESEDKNNMNASHKNANTWSCHICTFINTPRASKCIQCLTLRKMRTSPSRSASPLIPSSPMNSNESISHPATKTSCRCSEVQVITSSTLTNSTTTTTSSSDRFYNDRNRSETLSHQHVKWTCPSCTYDNWEAALKCVLCFTPKRTENTGGHSLKSLELAADERRTNTPSPPGAAKGNTHLSSFSSCQINTNLQNNKNKMKDNNEITSASEHLNFIDDRCNEIYDMLIENNSRPTAKRAPSDVSRYLAVEIRRSISSGLKQRKGDFPCFFVNEFVTFSLPAEVEDLPPEIQERLFDEYLDRDVQKELEEESPIINWSIELTERLGSRLYALWNRSTGDCLLDSVLQATWGIFDRENMLRKALSDSLVEASSVLFPRFREAETLQANLLHFTLDDDQWQEDWAVVLSLATQPGQSLEQIHIFTLAHIIRRPIIVYAIRIVKSFRGETLGYAGYEGIYLPLLWEPSFCWKSPIALGYTRGHFSALVPIEPDSSDAHIGAGANLRSTDDVEVVFLPLVTSERQLLPLHFLGHSEIGREEEIMRQWLDCCVTTGGILVAQQKIPKRGFLVAQMMEEWLNFYRNLSSLPATLNVTSNTTQDYSSDADSD